MNEREFKDQAERAVHAQMLTSNTAMIWTCLGYTELQVRQVIAGMIERARTETFEGADPAQADAMASEIETSLETLLSQAFERFQDLRRMLQKPQEK